MRLATTSLCAALGLLATCALWAGCSSNTGTGFGGDDGGGGETGSDDGGDDVNLIGGDSGDGAGNCSACSADLHDVLDCSDPPHVITTCPPDQGCGPGGQCVPACDSAAANKSSIGCDYYAIPADGWSNIPEYNPGTSDGSCFAAFVTNNWGSSMKVTLEWKGKTIDATPYAYIPQGSGANITYQNVGSGGIPANQMAIVFLAQYGQAQIYKTLCPPSVQAAITTEDVGSHGTGMGNAIRIKTDVPAVVYDIYPYGGAQSYITSATLLLPTTAWDVNYVAVTAWPGMTIFNQGRPSTVDVVAMQNGTKVTISPTAAIVARGSVAGTGKGVPVTYSLNKGELLHLAQIDDLSGSPLQATAAVGVWGGHYCMNIPDQNTAACDAANQQIPPVQALGSQYVAVRYRTRTAGEETASWRIMGMVKGTTLTYDPPSAGGPTTLDVGQLAEFQTPAPFVVKSQDEKHPFYLAAHMGGGSLAQVPAGGVGDPETVNVVPPQQYLPSYIFFTDPTYSETNLVLTRGKASDGTYKDVKLDCVSGNVGGWQSIGGSGYQYTRVDLQTGHAPVAGCDNGRHFIKSDAPFGITVWGFDQYVSYAYPAGASVKPINSVVVPPNPK